jgi:hypothetical protein
MKIYDSENKKVLSSVTLFLTPKEAKELAQAANDLAENPRKQHHHLRDASYEVEINVAVYMLDNITKFDAESRAVIGQTLSQTKNNDEV